MPLSHSPLMIYKKMELLSNNLSLKITPPQMITAKSEHKVTRTVPSLCSGVLSSQCIDRLDQRLVTASVFCTVPSGITTSIMGPPCSSLSCNTSESSVRLLKLKIKNTRKRHIKLTRVIAKVTGTRLLVISSLGTAI